MISETKQLAELSTDVLLSSASFPSYHLRIDDFAMSLILDYTNRSISGVPGI